MAKWRTDHAFFFKKKKKSVIPQTKPERPDEQGSYNYTHARLAALG